MFGTEPQCPGFGDTGSKVQPRNLAVFDSRQQECHSLKQHAHMRPSKKVAVIAELSAGVSITV